MTYDEAIKKAEYYLEAANSTSAYDWWGPKTALADTALAYLAMAREIREGGK